MGEMSTERELDAAVARKVFGLNPEMRVIRLAYFELEEEVSDEMTLPHDPPFEYERDWAIAGAPGEWWDTGRRLPRYSTDIAAAWQTVERLAQMNPPRWLEIGRREHGWTVSVWVHCQAHGDRCEALDRPVWIDDQETAPLAICRAALQVVGAVPESV